jgi:type I restriction enzyme, S subunit
VIGLPNDWQSCKLGEVASKPQYGWTSSARPDASGPPLLRTTDITRGPVNWALVPRCVTSPRDDDKYRLRDGDLVVSRAGSVGASALIRNPPDSVFASYLMRFTAGPRVLPEFLRLFLQSPPYWTQISEVADGVAMPNINATKMAGIVVPVPPRTEQVRIVEILEDHLSRLDAADAGLVDSQRRMTVLRERLVRDAITGSSVPGKRQMPDLAEAGTREGDLPSLPVGWAWRRLGDIADVVGGVTKDANKQSDPDHVEVPFLRVANVQRGALRLEKVTLIRVPQSKAKTLALQRGDILLNEGGDRDKLARGWVWEGQIDGCIHQNHVFRARVRGELDPYFLSWTANTIGGRWAELNGKQSVNLASISLSMIRRMPVIVPPGDLSRTIVEELHGQLASLDRVAAELESARTRGQGLRRALLAAAFSGKLTDRHTDQEVTEESSSVRPQTVSS